MSDPLDKSTGVCHFCGCRIRYRPSLGCWVRDPAPSAGSVEFCADAPAAPVQRGGRTTSPIKTHHPLDLSDPDNVRSYLEAP